jgi:hypothetical protein
VLVPILVLVLLEAGERSIVSRFQVISSSIFYSELPDGQLYLERESFCACIDNNGNEHIQWV